ncbi:Defensin-5 [Podila epigama]|nr:Defensin-5 [Podila epigama]
MSNNQHSPIEDRVHESDIKDQDRLLPIANVARIMKKSLPENAKISKEAKEVVQGCVTEFIAFITSKANKRCQDENRKTVNGDDLLWAMNSLELGQYASVLQEYLVKYREATKVIVPDARPDGDS